METQGDVLIRGLQDRQTDSIIDVIIGNNDADTYRFDPMSELLAKWEKTNKDKHGKHCNEKQKHLYLFVISVYDTLGRESLVVLANLSRLMTAKMDESI